MTDRHPPDARSGADLDLDLDEIERDIEHDHDSNGHSDAITVHLDERTLRLPSSTTLQTLLDHEAIVATAVATAVNGQFVPRAARGDTRLADGDQVLLFQPIVGG